MAASLMNKRYQIVKKLGAGGMGEVFIATDRLNMKPVALKRILFKTPTDAHLDSLSRREAFAHEFALLASLRHPHIISVIDFGFDDYNSPFFTMELVEDPQALLDTVENAKLDKKITVLLEILQALDYLHRRHVVHRDLKPDNILIGKTGIKLLDFGLAKEIHTDGEKSEEIAGTLAYIAPEIISGEVFTIAADLYAFGLIAHEIFLGFHPYKGESLLDLIQKALYLTPDVSAIENPLLAEAIERLLAKDPKKRLTALEAIEALCQAVDRALPPETQHIRDSYLTTARFVGREKELATLEVGLVALEVGGLQFYLIAGENGAGKTRFLNEVAILGLTRGVLVLRGRAIDAGANSLHLFRTVMRSVVLYVDVSPEEASILSDIIPDIQTLLQLPDLAPAAPLPPPQAKQRLVSCIIALLKRINHPTLLTLEDIQWAGDSYELLDQLTKQLTDAPVLILASYRPEERPDLDKTFPSARVLPIPKLSKTEIQALSQSILGSASDHEIVDLLDAQSEGNAFFVIELIRTLAESAGSIANISKMTLPLGLLEGGIQTLLQKHLVRLDDTNRNLMMWAAVAGQELDLDLLYHAFARDVVDTFLLMGQEMRFLHIQEEKWQFSQDRLRRAILNTLSPEQSQALHRAVAEAIEATKPNTQSLAAKLAHHWKNAADPLKERHYTKIAAEQALKIGIYTQALPLLERALTLYSAESNQAVATLKEYLDVQLLYCSALIATKGQAANEVSAAYDVARGISEQLGPTPETGNIYFGMAAFYFSRGRHQTARSLLNQTLQLADHYADDAMRMQASMSMSNVLFWMGDFQRSLDYSAQVLRYYDTANPQEFNVRYAQNPRITTMNSRVWVTYLTGRPSLARRLADETLSRAEALAHPFNKAISLQIIAFLHLHRRDAATCYTTAQTLLGFAQQHGFVIYIALGDILSAWALAKMDPDGHIETFKTALKRWEAAGAKIGNSVFFALSAEIYLEKRDFDALHSALDAGFDHVEQTSEKAYLAELYRIRGVAYFEQGQAEQGIAALDQARHVTKEQGASLLELRALIDSAIYAPSPQLTQRVVELYSRFEIEDYQEPLIQAGQYLLP